MSGGALTLLFLFFAPVTLLTVPVVIRPADSGGTGPLAVTVRPRLAGHYWVVLESKPSSGPASPAPSPEVRVRVADTDAEVPVHIREDMWAAPHEENALGWFEARRGVAYAVTVDRESRVVRYAGPDPSLEVWLDYRYAMKIYLSRFFLMTLVCPVLVAVGALLWRSGVRRRRVAATAPPAPSFVA